MLQSHYVANLNVNWVTQPWQILIVVRFSYQQVSFVIFFFRLYLNLLKYVFVCHLSSPPFCFPGGASFILALVPLHGPWPNASEAQQLFHSSSKPTAFEKRGRSCQSLLFQGSKPFHLEAMYKFLNFCVKGFWGWLSGHWLPGHCGLWIFTFFS